MAIDLTKNQSISLDKAAGPGFEKLKFGLGWDPLKSGFFSKMLGSGDEIDLDASCIVLDSDFKLIDLVWFRQLNSKDGSIRHSGDNRTGDGGGDDESISVELGALPPSVAYMVFTVNSFTGQDFSKISKAYCRIVSVEDGDELARFNLSKQGAHTGVVMASLSRIARGWAFKAIGQVTHGRSADDLVNLAIKAVRP